MENYTLTELQKSSLEKMNSMNSCIVALSLYMFINPYKKVIYRVIY